MSAKFSEAVGKMGMLEKTAGIFSASGVDSDVGRQPLSICLVNGGLFEKSLLVSEVRRSGFDLIEFQDPGDFMAGFWKNKKFSLLVVAARSDEDFEFISKFLEVANSPVLLLIEDKHWGKLVPMKFDSAQVDVLFLSKVNAQELIWRVEKLLRGFYPAKNKVFESEEFSWGDYRFVNGARTVVFYKGTEIQLQRRQFIFALLLFSNIGQIIKRGSLPEFFGVPAKKNSRAIDVCAVQLRKKLGLTAENGLVLRAVYGLGYQLISISKQESAFKSFDAEADGQVRIGSERSYAAPDRRLSTSPTP